MELIAMALSNVSSSNGKLSADARRRSTRPLAIAVLFRDVAYMTISLEGSTPATYPAEAELASS
jgi:hypothetical protein